MRPIVERICPLCGHGRAVVVLTLQPPFAPAHPRPRADGDWRLVRCQGCGLGHLDPMPTPAQMRAYLAGLSKYTRPRNAAAAWTVRRRVFADATERLARWRPDGGRVLDVGCAYGHLLRLLADRGWEAWGVELSADGCGYARTALGLEHIVQGDVREAALPGGRFDAVAMLDVLYYCPDPLATLGRVRTLLRPGGRLLLRLCNRIGLLDWRSRLSQTARGRVPRVPSARIWEWSGDSVVHFSPATIRLALGRAGFEVARISSSVPNAAANGHPGHELGRRMLAAGLRTLDGAITLGGSRDPAIAPSITVEASAVEWDG